jgi:hypothetical protein
MTEQLKSRIKYKEKPLSKQIISGKDNAPFGEGRACPERSRRGEVSTPLPKPRFFAEFILSEANVLRMGIYAFCVAF